MLIAIVQGNLNTVYNSGVVSCSQQFLLYRRRQIILSLKTPRMPSRKLAASQKSPDHSVITTRGVRARIAGFTAIPEYYIFDAEYL